MFKRYLLYKNYGIGKEIVYVTDSKEEAVLLSKKEGLKIEEVMADNVGEQGVTHVEEKQVNDRVKRILGDVKLLSEEEIVEYFG